MKKKTRYTMYPAWEYGQEVIDLNELSQAGWQLQKGGCFHSTFVFDDTMRYRYALDYQRQVDDPVRYRETFAEQGWEYVNATFNGWHYFRKTYDPALPEEEYQIYTDTASLQEMAGRWKRLAYILGGMELAVGLLGLIANFDAPRASSVLLGIGSVLLGSILLLGGQQIGWPSKRRFITSGWVLLPVLVVFLASLVLSLVYHI